MGCCFFDEKRSDESKGSQYSAFIAFYVLLSMKKTTDAHEKNNIIEKQLHLLHLSIVKQVK